MEPESQFAILTGYSTPNRTASPDKSAYFSDGFSVTSERKRNTNSHRRHENLLVYLRAELRDSAASDTASSGRTDGVLPLATLSFGLSEDFGSAQTPGTWGDILAPQTQR